jgi:hypothetical protein
LPCISTIAKFKPVYLLLAILLLAGYSVTAQDSSKLSLSVDQLSSKTLDKLNSRYASLTDKINKRAASLLQHMQSKEAGLQAEVAGKDSSKAAALFANTAAQYQQLQNNLQSKTQQVEATAKKYLPGLDSMQTALSFLQQKGINLPTGQAGLPAQQLQQIEQLSSQLKQLQASMANAGAIEDFIKQREQLLKTQLSSLVPGNQLLGINKEVYYYQQELSQYRDIINNPDKLKDAVLTIVSKVPAFQQYWQKYSILGRLFPLPDNYGTPAALAGLQTNAQVTAMVQQRMGISNIAGTAGNGAAAPAIPQQYLQGAQDELDKLKDKVAQAGGSSSDMTVPDFKPDEQHGKRFLQHFTYGFNIQTAASTNYLPSITDLALTVGFKFSDKLEAGIGGSYKLGMGSIHCIHFSSEGVSTRSYLDIKAKGSIWITGGWEYNYLQSFQSLQDLHSNVNVWQKSALAGLTKKYKVGKKEGNMQLLYDFLAARQVPAAQPFKFRLGYSF